MKSVAILAVVMAIAAAMPAAAYGADYSSADAWEAEAAGNLSAWASRQDGVEQYGDLKENGRVEYGGHEWTWYSEKVLPGDGLKELNANGRTVDSDGYVVDGEGYIAVASPWGSDPVGTVVDTPYGKGKVYDECEGDSYDVYTSW